MFKGYRLDGLLPSVLRAVLNLPKLRHFKTVAWLGGGPITENKRDPSFRVCDGTNNIVLSFKPVGILFVSPV